MANPTGTAPDLATEPIERSVEGHAMNAIMEEVSVEIPLDGPAPVQPVEPQEDAQGSADGSAVAPIEESDAVLPPNPPAKPEPKLKEFRTAKGTLDEDRLEKIVAEGKQAYDQFTDLDRLIWNDPDAKIAVLKAMKKAGRTLQPEYEALIATPAPVAPITPPKPKYTMEQIQTGYNQIYAQKGPAAAQQYWDHYVTKPAIEAAAEAKVAADRAERAKEAEAARKAQAEAASTTTFKAEISDAAKAYPTILTPDPKSPYGFSYKDKQVNDWLFKVKPQVPVKEAITLALKSLGRYKSPTSKTTAARSTYATKPVQARKPVADDGEIFEEVTIQYE